jgi:hypothetical protein
MRVQVDAISGGEDYTIDFKDIIDNRDCNYHIALKEITYVVGYFNISRSIGNNLAEYFNGTTRKTVVLPDGYYNVDTYFSEIFDQMKIKGDKPVNLKYQKWTFNGKVVIRVLDKYTFNITSSNKNLLGFNNPVNITLVGTSDKPVNFAPFSNLCIHVQEINKTKNYVKGQYSDVISYLPLTKSAFGETVSSVFGEPLYIPLQKTTISSLHITVTDINNNIVSFNGMPISYLFDIKNF